MKRPAVILVCAALFAAAAAAAYQIWNSVGRPAEAAHPEATGPRDHVTLSDEKFVAAQIQVSTASKRKLQSVRTVPGRIEYNATRHVEVKSPFDGLIRRIEVKVGDRVLISKYGGTEVKLENDKYTLVREDDILGVIA